MIKFSDLLKYDCENMPEYEDERLISNLYCTSLSYSLREEKNSEDFKEKNKWLFDSSDVRGKISTINFDMLPRLCGCEGLSSCDAFFYNYSGIKKSLLIEFKNCDKADLQKKYLKINSKDSIIKKISNSKNLISSQIEFEGKNTGNELIATTHIIIIYNGKNNVPSMSIPFQHSSKYKRTDKGKPQKAIQTNLVKSTNEDNDKFGLEIRKIGFSQCIDSDFPVPGEPDSKKSKGIGKIRNYTLFSANDFRKLIDLRYFDEWESGKI